MKKKVKVKWRFIWVSSIQKGKKNVRRRRIAGIWQSDQLWWVTILSIMSQGQSENSSTVILVLGKKYLILVNSLSYKIIYLNTSLFFWLNNNKDITNNDNCFLSINHLKKKKFLDIFCGSMLETVVKWPLYWRKKTFNQIWLLIYCFKTDAYLNYYLQHQ